MHVVSTSVILASLATSIHAGIINPKDTNDVGSFNIFGDPGCKHELGIIGVEDEDSTGVIIGIARSVKAFLPGCSRRSPR